jgi:glycogen phosphorylase
MAVIDRFIPRTRIAYLSMEIAWEPTVPTYAGGLGVLAGDTARSCAQLDLPVVFVTPISREGYLSQSILPKGRQADHPEPWQPENWAIALDAMIAVRIEGRTVWVRPWLRVLEEPGGAVPVILLDTRLETNEPEDRTITDRLYGGDERQRLRQEAVLGLGGERVLHALGFAIETWHLNEGHAALAALARLKRRPRPGGLPDQPGLRFDIDGVRAQCVFTTHTPVEAGHDRFDYATVGKILGDVFPHDQLRLLGGADELNMTRLALTLSGWVNGVARRHGETTRQMFPGHRIHDITNGIHVPSWAHPAIARLFDEVAPEWRHDPETLANADRIADEALGAAHAAAKAELLAEIEQRSGVRIDPALPLIAYARRMTGYKR